MKQRPTLYSQFDGEAIDGKRYGLGDPIDADVNPEVLTILTDQGRIATTVPVVMTTPLVGSEKPVDDMSRSELEGSVMSIMAAKVRESDEDKLRTTIENHRADEADRNRSADEGGEGEGGKTDDDMNDEPAPKPLEKMTTAELNETATNESVEFGENVKTNADRVKAIQTARDVKAKAGGAPEA